MTFSTIIYAGIAGTFFMTVFVEAIAWLLGKPFHVIRNLSHILQFSSPAPQKKKTLVFLLATVLHYTIGVLFAFCFTWFLQADVLNCTFIDSVSFGALAGTVGIIGWRVAFAIHPEPPRLNLWQYLALIWLGHLVFSIGLFVAYSNFGQTDWCDPIFK
ncbi:MAG TPA: hypothetical protein VGD65_10225 [Chryseosolibacter sp.]